MPRYVIERNVGAITREQLTMAAKSSLAALATLPSIQWVKSYVSEAEGKIYCEYEAPDAESILEHARRAGLPADKISLVALEIYPAMFQ
jgi:hypothetical protein